MPYCKTHHRHHNGDPCPDCTAKALADKDAALERAALCLNDWLHIYAPDQFDPDDVARSTSRVKYHGTIAYISDALSAISAALKK